MNINDIAAAARVDAVWVVFANVLLQQLGIPDLLWRRFLLRAVSRFRTASSANY